MIITRNEADQILERLMEGNQVWQSDVLKVVEELNRLRAALSFIASSNEVDAKKIAIYALTNHDVETLKQLKKDSDVFRIGLDTIYDLKEKFEFILNDSSVSSKQRERAAGAVQLLEILLTRLNYPLTRDGKVARGDIKDSIFIEFTGIFFYLNKSLYFADASRVASRFSDWFARDEIDNLINRIVRITIESDE